MPNQVLHVVNRTARAARVRLSCADHLIWDVWVTPMGAALAPAFAPQRMTLDARVIERATQVAYHSTATGVDALSTITARLVSDSGARMFTLDACPQTAAPGLHMQNETSGMLDFVARYPDSPYRLAGFVEPGRLLRITYAPLDLMIVQDGLSVLQRLPAAAGAWVIEPPSVVGGFPLIEPLPARERDVGDPAD